MKVAVVSDVHLGDPVCTMVTPSASGYVLGPKYPAFRDAAGTGNDYLILLGDIFEFAISNYADAYAAAEVFLQQVARDGIAKEIIYVPGNHDFALWHILLHEFNVINQVKNGQPPKRRWSVPAVLDDRPNSATPGLTLTNVAPQPGAAASASKYGGLFLDALTKATPADKGLVFNVAYPNLYFVTAQGQCVLLTHGHYFQPYWAFLGEFAKEIAKEDLRVGGGRYLSIDDIVSINFPLNELASSGIGQAGPLADLALKVQAEVKRKNLQRVERYVDRARLYVDNLMRFPWYKQYLEWLSDAVLGKVRGLVLDSLKNVQGVRYDREFIEKPAVKERFRLYYVASLIEASRLAEQGFSLPHPTSVIFGHTHEAIPWGSQEAPSEYLEDIAGTVRLYNTGGWLAEKGPLAANALVGAGVFTYDSASGWSSKIV